MNIIRVHETQSSHFVRMLIIIKVLKIKSYKNKIYKLMSNTN